MGAIMNLIGHVIVYSHIPQDVTKNGNLKTLLYYISHVHDEITNNLTNH